ncbi:hypothetical protein BN14_09167 [Rhizoctonia solani AG-1 IB]|uniref:Uncharacterized protein n=1 Tax=Thanatephorus cucumeris (strain AG1-IB / isolate 7/3/14) TaxID=1108050 RepID=M5C518_THACB|nr:hypothetical protein BN14_09167 [Rhizoctonia solani AG-1 IB]
MILLTSAPTPTQAAELLHTMKARANAIAWCQKLETRTTATGSQRQADAENRSPTPGVIDSVRYTTYGGSPTACARKPDSRAADKPCRAKLTPVTTPVLTSKPAGVSTLVSKKTPTGTSKGSPAVATAITKATGGKAAPKPNAGKSSTTRPTAAKGSSNRPNPPRPSGNLKIADASIPSSANSATPTILNQTDSDAWAKGLSEELQDLWAAASNQSRKRKADDLDSATASTSKRKVKPKMQPVPESDEAGPSMDTMAVPPDNFTTRKVKAELIENAEVRADKGTQAVQARRVTRSAKNSTLL